VLNLLSVSTSILLLYITQLYTSIYSKNEENEINFNITKTAQSTTSFPTNSNNGFIMKLKEYQNMTKVMDKSSINNESKKTNTIEKSNVI